MKRLMINKDKGNWINRIKSSLEKGPKFSDEISIWCNYCTKVLRQDSAIDIGFIRIASPFDSRQSTPVSSRKFLLWLKGDERKAIKRLLDSGRGPRDLGVLRAFLNKEERRAITEGKLRTKFDENRQYC